MKGLSFLGYANSGKTSIFNSLTKHRKKVGNYAGVTTSVFKADIFLKDSKYKVVDLPGINSFNGITSSKDEIEARKYIEKNKDDLFLNVVDICQLEKHLMLTLNAILLGYNIVLVVNKIDKTNLDKKKLESIKNKLQKELSIPVVMVSTKKQTGLEELKKEVENFNNTQNTKKETTLLQCVQKAKQICKNLGDLHIKSKKITRKIDNIVLNNFLSVPIFALFMYLLLFITMVMHSVFVDLIDELAGIYFIDLPSNLLAKLNIPKILDIVIVQGFGSGIQTVLTFIPIIFTLFFCLAVLEQSGYMARQIYITDGIMQKIGLSGKSFVPLIMNLGCTVACSSSCRVLEKEQDRRLTLMLAPSVSCSARLAIYVYLAYICFGNNALNVVFLMYVLGILFLVTSGVFLSKSLIKTDKQSFIVELPIYQVPSFKSIAFSSLLKLKSFLIGAGKTIVPLIALITLLNSVSFKGKIIEEYSLDKSILAQASQFITPLFNPIGISNNNSEATFSLITGFLAKEAVVATLNSMYFSELERNDERTILQSTQESFINFKDNLLSMDYLDFFGFESSKESIGDNMALKKAVLLEKFGSIYAIFAFLIFLLLYTPCAAAMSSIVSEIGKKWALAVAFWSFLNAYLMAFVYYNIASTFFGLKSILLTAFVLALYTFIFFIFKNIGKKYENSDDKFIVVAKKCK